MRLDHANVPRLTYPPARRSSLGQDSGARQGFRPLQRLRHRLGRPFTLLGAVAALAIVAPGCRTSPPAEVRRVQPFDFVQMCDPQLGFGGYAEDVARFEQAVSQINALRPDLVVICGDLVNAASAKSFAEFNALSARLVAPHFCAPGNHDLGNTPTRESLRRYRKCIGKDYYSFTHKGCTFVILNSQLWKAPLAPESEKQDAWLKSTLEKAARKRQPIFIVAHYPLFLKEPGEPEAYFNLAPAKRQELLAMFQRCGVVAILAGHTHETIVQTFEGIQMVTSETTSRNFDKRPFGFRIWHVDATRPYRNEFVPLAAPPGS